MYGTAEYVVRVVRSGWVYGPGGYTGGCTGWVIPGEYPAAHRHAGEGPTDSGAGPGRPTGPGVGGLWEPGVTVGGTAPGPPSGPGRYPMGPSLSRTLRMPT